MSDAPIRLHLPLFFINLKYFAAALFNGSRAGD
jgi:hypothetical protein